ncbi:hypothetical protein [Streptomyces mirabilis]|uniref:hypothetical protein n=1 Tax=Streptomyces mirabilis TaxID=68239 RepID=UPI00368C9522
MTRTPLKKAPFDRNGSLLNYISYPDQVHEWRPNNPFPALLILEGTTRGLSAARFVWHSDKGSRFEMFMLDAADLMRANTNLYGGTVDTWWTVQKRGKNYGVRLATSDDLQRAGHIAGPKADCPACEGVAYSYVSWCPLAPTADKPHQFQLDVTARIVLFQRCLCGQLAPHHLHTGESEGCPCDEHTLITASGVLTVDTLEKATASLMRSPLLPQQGREDRL